jgi:hypothetical protein
MSTNENFEPDFSKGPIEVNPSVTVMEQDLRNCFIDEFEEIMNALEYEMVTQVGNLIPHWRNRLKERYSHLQQGQIALDDSWLLEEEEEGEET